MGMWTIPKGRDEACKFSDDEISNFISTFAEAVVKRGMSVPAVMTLEMYKPLSFIGHTSLVMFGPVLEMIIDPVKMEKLQAVTADRDNIEKLMVSIENLEQKKQQCKEGE